MRKPAGEGRTLSSVTVPPPTASQPVASSCNLAASQPGATRVSASVLRIAARGRPIDLRHVEIWSINWRRTKPMLFCADGSDASTT